MTKTAKEQARAGIKWENMQPKEVEITTKEGEIQEKLHLLKHTSEVQSRIKTDITSDFTLAKLTPEDKQSIIEMTDNAYYVKSIMGKLLKQTKYTYNNGTWQKLGLNSEERKYIELLANKTYDAYMIRIYMTVVLSRNIEGNTLLKYLAQRDDQEEEQQQTEQEKTTLLSAMKKIMKKKPGEE